MDSPLMPEMHPAASRTDSAGQRDADDALAPGVARAQPGCGSDSDDDQRTASPGAGARPENLRPNSEHPDARLLIDFAEWHAAAHRLQNERAVREAAVAELAPIPWSIFLTLTYAEDPPTREIAEAHALRYAASVDAHVGRHPAYVGSVEGEPYPKDGYPLAPRTNVHMIFAGVDPTAANMRMLEEIWSRGIARAQAFEERHLPYVLKDYPQAGLAFTPRNLRWRVRSIRRRREWEIKTGRRTDA